MRDSQWPVAVTGCNCLPCDAADALWRLAVARRDLCMDKEVFPSTSKEELYLKACAILMRDHYKQACAGFLSLSCQTGWPQERFLFHLQIMGAIRRRLSPDSDLYEEDIVVGPFCRCRCFVHASALLSSMFVVGCCSGRLEVVPRASSPWMKHLTNQLIPLRRKLSRQNCRTSASLRSGGHFL